MTALFDTWQQKLARRMYLDMRVRLIGEALRRARAGTLEPDWRNHLLTWFPELVAVSPDNAALVAREATELPVQPWEPYAAHGDWREALDAWYSDTLALEAEHEAELLAPAPRPSDDNLEWYASGRELQQQADRATREGKRRERDCLGASYRAGLAAGGVEIDWVSWYRQRVIEWVDCGDGGDASAARAESMRIDYRRHLADQPGWREYLQQLPEYWTAQQKLARP